MVTSTAIQLTNKTGKTVRLSTYNNYNGFHKGTYPKEIENHQTIYFLFENQKGNESSGAIVYEGENEVGQHFDWLFAWYNKDGAEPLTYKAYTEIVESPHIWDWDEVEEKLMKSVPISHGECEDFMSDAIIIKPLYPVIYQGKMSVEWEED